MIEPFRRTAEGTEGQLRPAEIELLRDLAGQLRALYAEPVVGDPALERLFPDGRRDDPAAAAELRALTEDDLREAKTVAIDQVLSSLADDGERLLLDEVEVELWLRALTDLRLTVAARLGVTTPEDAERLQMDEMVEREDAAAYPWVVYEWLGWLQGSLVEAVLE